MKPYAKEEVGTAYEKLIYAQGLIDFVLHAGFDLREELKAKNEGSLISIFSILQEYLKPIEPIMCELECGNRDYFTEIWEKPKEEEA